MEGGLEDLGMRYLCACDGGMTVCIGHVTSVPYLQSVYVIPQIFRVDVQSGGDWSMVASVPRERAMGAFQ